MATSIPFYQFSPNDKGGNPQWRPIASPCPSSPRNHITSIRLLTWNIWFDKLSQEQRFSAIIQQIVSLPHLDIAALQEVTPEFIQLAKAHPQIQREWLLTDYTDEEHDTEVERTWYGNIFLVRKGWEGIRGWVRKFETSNMKRFVVILEIQIGSESLIRVTNGHFDSRDFIHEREKQFQKCHSLLTSASLPGSATLTSSTLILLAGDLNLHSTCELEYTRSHSYEDSILSTELDAEITARASASIGLTFPKEGKLPRRSDFVMSLMPSQWKCTEYFHRGTDPITGQDGKKVFCAQGKDGHLFPSDHLAVYTQFNLN